MDIQAYWENRSRAEYNPVSACEKYAELSAQTEQIKNLLLPLLSNDIRPLFLEYERLVREMESVSESEVYTKGFHHGGRIAAEMLLSK